MNLLNEIFSLKLMTTSNIFIEKISFHDTFFRIAMAHWKKLAQTYTKPINNSWKLLTEEGED